MKEKFFLKKREWRDCKTFSVSEKGHGLCLPPEICEIYYHFQFLYKNLDSCYGFWPS